MTSCLTPRSFRNIHTHLYCEFQVKRLPYHINDHEFSDALVAAFLELHHASGASQQREVSPSPSLHIQTIKPKLIRSPTDFSRAKPGLLFFDIYLNALYNAPKWHDSGFLCLSYVLTKDPKRWLRSCCYFIYSMVRFEIVEKPI